MSKLYIVPTPIGNLGDMTYRAVAVLKEVDLILAEDTRNSQKLLHHYEIATPMESNHQHNEHKKLENIIRRIQSGIRMAVISDAGTPGISDPGFLLVRECIREGIDVECLPGASAVLPAIVVSGFPCDSFFFEGFLPHKKGRQTRLLYLSELPHTFALYESPHRLLKTIEQLKQVLGNNRKVCVARELTKKFEEIKRGSLEELHKHFFEKPIKGEIVIVVEGKKSEQREHPD